MSPLHVNDLAALRGEPLFGADGVKIGKISDIYVDNDTHEAEWALVHTGLFGGRESFVPLAAASRHGSGVQVPYDKDLVRDAPNAEPDGELSQDEEARLYSHYGLHHSEAASVSGPPTGAAAPRTGTSSPASAEHASDRRSDDGSMVRSEERLTVRVQRRPSETVRLRKVVVTEDVTQTVAVRHEELVIEREAIVDGTPVAGGDVVAEDHEITLHAERPVIEKEVVAVERVRVGTREVTENVQVGGEVRKEQIEMTQDAAAGGRVTDSPVMDLGGTHLDGSHLDGTDLDGTDVLHPARRTPTGQQDRPRR